MGIKPYKKHPPDPPNSWIVYVLIFGLIFVLLLAMVKIG